MSDDKKPCNCTESAPSGSSVDLTPQEVIKQLLVQRAGFVTRFEAGEEMVDVGIQFIDNVLSQMLPGYMPGKGCGCENQS